jgi:hypothetical protein
MTKLFPDEVAFKIPGVMPVMSFSPWDSEMNVSKEDVEARTETQLTQDTVFQDGKTYYKPFKNLTEFLPATAGTAEQVAAGEADYTVGETVPDGRFYEQVSIPGCEVTTTTLWERYTDGTKVEFDPGTNYPRRVTTKIEIVKTIIVTSEGGTKQRTTKYHAWDFWDKRKTATYVPLCIRLNSNDLNESARMFR